MSRHLASVEHLKGLSGFDLCLDLRPVRLQVFDSYCFHSLNVYSQRYFLSTLVVSKVITDWEAFSAINDSASAPIGTEPPTLFPYLVLEAEHNAHCVAARVWVFMTRRCEAMEDTSEGSVKS